MCTRGILLKFHAGGEDEKESTFIFHSNHCRFRCVKLFIYSFLQCMDVLSSVFLKVTTGRDEFAFASGDLILHYFFCFKRK